MARQWTEADRQPGCIWLEWGLVAHPAIPYRFGDLLALARRSWVLAMADELQARGYEEYRLSDAASLRLLLAGPLSIGRLASASGVTRQAARKLARGLEERHLAVTQGDPGDARKVNVELTAAGSAYAQAIVAVIAALNTRLAQQVTDEALAGADMVLRAAITDSALQRIAGRISSPANRPVQAASPS